MTDRAALRSALWCAAYAVSVVVGRQFVAPETGLSLFWPAAGVAVMWLLPAMSRARRGLDLALLFLVTVAATSLTGSPPAAALAFGVANTVQASVAVGVFRLVRGALPGRLADVEPRSLRDLGVVCATAVVAATVGSPLGALGAMANGGAVTPEVLGAWVARNGSGITVLVLCTAAIAGQVRRWRASTSGVGSLRSLATGQERPVVEFLAAAATATVLFTAVFGTSEHLPIAFLTLAPSAWFGIRFAPSVAGSHGLVQSVVVLVATTTGRGPFGGITDVTARAVTVQLFLVTGLLMAMTLSVAVAERRVLLDRAQASEARAQARVDLLDATTRDLRAGLVVVDAAGEVVLANTAARQLLGDDVVAALGTDARLPQLRRPDGVPIDARDRPTVRALAGQVVHGEDVVRSAGSGDRVLALSARPIEVEVSSGERFALTVVRDVTEDRAQVAELQAFAGVVAHDLKNPVAAVMSWSEILDDQLVGLGAGAADARATLARVFSTSDRMRGLVDDLLAYAQAGAGELTPVPVRLADLVHQATSQLPPTDVAVADLRVVDSAGELARDVVVDVDVLLVRQLLVNLLGNALKYVAPDRTPVVRVSARTVGERVEVEVRDNGIGIPDDERVAVFDGFVRSSRTRSTFPGTGLGLAICARAVARHGGTIRATDAGPDGGTVVTFTLPAGDRSAVPAAAGLTAAEATGPLAAGVPSIAAALAPDGSHVATPGPVDH